MVGFGLLPLRNRRRKSGRFPYVNHRYLRVVGWCNKCQDVKVKVASSISECSCTGRKHNLDERGTAKWESPQVSRARKPKTKPRTSTYPKWMRDIVETMYSQGLGSYKIHALTGITSATALAWVKSAGIARTKAKAQALTNAMGGTHG